MSDILLVFHPFSGRRSRLAEVEALRSRLSTDGRAVEMLATIAGRACVDRISQRLEANPPQSVVAAGGDGTVRDVVEALLRRPPSLRPPLALVAKGTANNAARSIDPSLPRRPEHGEDRVASVLAEGVARNIDVGLANGRAFLGSVAVAMDADILVWRNAARSRVPASVAGYPLYLASCAVNALRDHGGPVRLKLTRTPGIAATIVEDRAVNVLVTNTALYAGEFRFVGGSRHDDGVLDVLWNRSMGDYLRRYAAAWPRHLRAARGMTVRNDTGAATAVRVVMQWKQPMAWQLDGEEMPPQAQFDIEVVPSALRVLVPPMR